MSSCRLLQGVLHSAAVLRQRWSCACSMGKIRRNFPNFPNIIDHNKLWFLLFFTLYFTQLKTWLDILIFTRTETALKNATGFFWTSIIFFSKGNKSILILINGSALWQSFDRLVVFPYSITWPLPLHIVYCGQKKKLHRLFNALNHQDRVSGQCREICLCYYFTEIIMWTKSCCQFETNLSEGRCKILQELVIIKRP